MPVSILTFPWHPFSLAFVFPLPGLWVGTYQVSLALLATSSKMAAYVILSYISFVLSHHILREKIQDSTACILVHKIKEASHEMLWHCIQPPGIFEAKMPVTSIMFMDTYPHNVTFIKKTGPLKYTPRQNLYTKTVFNHAFYSVVQRRAPWNWKRVSFF